MNSCSSRMARSKFFFACSSLILLFRQLRYKVQTFKISRAQLDILSVEGIMNVTYVLGPQAILGFDCMKTFWNYKFFKLILKTTNLTNFLKILQGCWSVLFWKSPISSSSLPMPIFRFFWGRMAKWAPKEVEYSSSGREN